MKDGTKITITAIIALVIIESIALFNGIDSWMFGIVVAVIAGLGGYKIRGVKVSIFHEEECPNVDTTK